MRGKGLAEGNAARKLRFLGKNLQQTEMSVLNNSINIKKNTVEGRLSGKEDKVGKILHLNIN